MVARSYASNSKQQSSSLKEEAEVSADLDLGWEKASVSSKKRDTPVDEDKDIVEDREKAAKVCIYDYKMKQESPSDFLRK